MGSIQDYLRPLAAGMLKTVLLQQTQFTAFWLQLLRKSQHMQHRTKFWIKSADEDRPRVVPAWYNVMFGRPRTFSLIAWYFSFSLAWHHLNFRTAIVRGADIKWALHHCPTPTIFWGNFFRSPLESEWNNQNIFKREQSTKTVKKIQRVHRIKMFYKFNNFKFRQAVTTCGSLAARLWGNGERMRSWRESGREIN